ncbi:MAG: DUF2225 domain-containing protein [Planctomycetota bacterium]|jgi:uncharacterized protein (DUF2225 family)
MATAARKEAFYKKKFTCLIDGQTFDVFRMYPSVRRDCERVDDYFDAPYYDPGPDGMFTNNLLMEVRACPECGFASIDDRHFKTDLTGITPVELDKGARELLNQTAEKRTELLRKAKDLYTSPRTHEDAVLAYKMAILTSTMIYKSDPRRQAVETVRLANYALRLARICDEMKNEGQREGWRRAALEYLTKSYESDVMGDIRHRSCYQLSALCIYFGNDSFASRIFEKMRRDKSADATRAFTKYLNRIKGIWEHRDLHHGPGVEEREKAKAKEKQEQSAPSEEASS